MQGCYLIFKYDSKQSDISSLAGLLQKSFGEPCFEIKKAIGDNIFRTTYTGNLHISINEGRFVKSK